MRRFAKVHTRPTQKYISFAFGTLLAISETLPFFESFKSNGILHILKVVNEECKKF